MTIQRTAAGLALVALAVGAQANTVLSESFDNVAALPASGWAQINLSSAPIGQPWFQGNAGIFPAASGAPNAYIAANFLSTGSTTGTVSNWLMTPQIALDSSSVLSFMFRAAGDGFLDKVEVRLSTSGASTNVADFSSLIGSFQASTDTGWIGLSYTLGSVAVPTTGRLAFRYVVDSVATAGNYMGIDDVLVTSAIPEPGTWLLMGMGVAGLLLRRRVTV